MADSLLEREMARRARPQQSPEESLFGFQQSLAPVDRSGQSHSTEAPVDQYGLPPVPQRRGPATPKGVPGIPEAPPEEDPLRAAAIRSLQERGILDQYGELADAQESSALQLYGLQGAEVPVTQVNPDYEHRKRNYGEMLDANYREQGAQDVIDEGQMTAARISADSLDEVAAAEQRSYDRQQARMFAQEEAALDAQERSRRAYDTADAVSRRMLQASEIDTNRWWASRTAGQKVAAVGAMIARGFTGRDPMDIIDNEINRDIDAQKASFMNLATTYGAASNNVNLARGLYADIRARTADEREADQIYRLSKLQAIKAQFEATAARAGLPMMQAQIQQARAQFDTKILQAREALETLITHNVKKRTVMRQAKRVVTLADGSQVYVPIGGAGDRAAADFLGRESMATRQAGNNLAAASIEAEGKVAAAGAKRSASEENLRDRQRARIGKAIAEAADAIDAIDEYAKMFGNDLPGRTEETVVAGRGLVSPIDTEAIKRERRMRNFVLNLAAFSKGGKALTGTEKEAYQLLLGEEEGTLSGNQIRWAMGVLRQGMQRRIEAVKNTAPEDVQAEADPRDSDMALDEGLEGTEE